LLHDVQMRAWCVGFVVLLGCSSSAPSASPNGYETTDASTGDESPAVTADDGGTASDAAPDAPDDADASCVLWVDDAGITHGCTKGGQGPGDKDDGGGAPAPPPPDAALDASDLPLGAPCWDNAQCQSTICFDYAVKGTFCTQRCWTDSNCPPPMLGCNGMGVCRTP
jgi:hypothetical protein